MSHLVANLHAYNVAASRIYNKSREIIEKLQDRDGGWHRHVGLRLFTVPDKFYVSHEAATEQARITKDTVLYQKIRLLIRYVLVNPRCVPSFFPFEIALARSRPLEEIAAPALSADLSLSLSLSSTDSHDSLISLVRSIIYNVIDSSPEGPYVGLLLSVRRCKTSR